MSTMEQRPQPDIDLKNDNNFNYDYDLSNAWDQYDGELELDEFVEQARRSARLADLGVREVQLPDRYVPALGPDRTRNLEGRIREKVAEYKVSGTEEGALKQQARQLGKAARALNLGGGERTVTLEDRRDFLRDELNYSRDEWSERASDPVDAKVKDLEAQYAATHRELEELSAQEGSPDRWRAKHGEEYAASFAARVRLKDLRQEREQSAGQPEQSASQQATELAAVRQESSEIGF